MIDKYRYPLRFYFISAFIPWTLWLIAAYLSHQPGAEEYSAFIGALGLAGLCAPLCVAVYKWAKFKRVSPCQPGFFD